MRIKERLCGKTVLYDWGVASTSPGWTLIICLQSLEEIDGDKRGHVVTEQSTFHPPGDLAPAMTACCLTVEELTEPGGRDEGCLSLPPSTLASEYVVF